MMTTMTTTVSPTGIYVSVFNGKANLMLVKYCLFLEANGTYLVFSVEMITLINIMNVSDVPVLILSDPQSLLLD